MNGEVLFTAHPDLEGYELHSLPLELTGGFVLEGFGTGCQFVTTDPGGPIGGIVTVCGAMEVVVGP